MMANKRKLAQFYNVPSKKQRLEILKEVDVSYSVPNEDQPEPKPRDSYAGYTYLHFAVMKADLECTTELLRQEADLFKQGTHDGYTPLHVAIDNSTDKLSKNILESMGILQENQLVNILLSAHVKSGNALNPKCKKNGITHLHIACMFNHAEAVNFFVKAGESVHQTTDSDIQWLPDYTALHFAVRYSAFNAVAVLLEHGADIHAKDAKGTTPLQFLINHFMDVTDYLVMGTEDIVLPYEMELNRIDSIIVSIMKTRKADDVNFIDEAGLTSFHVACILKDSSFVVQFLQQNLDINLPVRSDSKHWPGWTPLHFAAFFSTETFKLLLKSGAKTNIQNTKGLTALNLFTRRHNPKVICSTLSIVDEFHNILLSDKSTKLSDIVQSMKDVNEFRTFLKSLEDVNIIVPQDSPIWPGYSLLHLAVMMNEKSREWKHFLQTSNYPDDFELPNKNLSLLENDIYLYGDRIQMLLSKKVDVHMINADGLSPLQLAFRLHSKYSVEELMNCSEKNLDGPGNLSHFHIACATDDDCSMVNEFLRQGADVNGKVKRSFEWYGKKTIFKKNVVPHLIPVTANSTPLHIAVIFGNVNAVYYLLDNGADVYAKDSHGFTPIHLTMSVHHISKTLAQLILGKITNLQDSVTPEGLSHLHVAAFANRSTSIRQLLNNGANVNVRFDVPSAPKQFGQLEYNLDERLFTVYFSGETPLHIATRNHAYNAIRVLITKGHADIHAESSHYRHISPLHYALDRITENYFKYYLNRLKREGRDYIGPIDDSEVTMLHIACAKFDLEWTKQLLENGANPNAQIRNHEKCDDEWRGDTPLHVLIYHASFENALPANFMPMLKLLMKNGADVTTLNDSGTAVHAAAEAAYPNLFYEFSDTKLFMRDVMDTLLKNQTNFDVNPVDSFGVSHFHIACVRNNVEIVTKFLDHGAGVNQSHDHFAKVDPGLQPLHYALAHGSFDVAKALIERGADVRALDRSGNTPLHIDIKNGFLDKETLDLLLSHGMDINTKNFDGETPLQCLLNSIGLTLTKLNLLLSRKSTMDITTNEESIKFIIIAVRKAPRSEKEAIFQKLVSEFDVHARIKKGFNAIHIFVATKLTINFGWIFYRYAIKQFVDMGCDFDQHDSGGKTALHRAVQFNNKMGVKALLLLGADINLVDNENESLLTNEMMEEFEDGELGDYDDAKFEIISDLCDRAAIMELIGLKISDSMKNAAEMGMKKYPFEANDIQYYETELEKMKGISITKTITVKDFLTERGVVRDYPMLADLYRETIDQFFKNVDYISKEFFTFSGILMMQYRKAVARMKLHEPAMSALISFSSIALPEFCWGLVLKEFSNEELESFLYVVEDIYFED